MGTRRLNILIAVFWLVATGWLVREKVLPQLRRGTPPDYLVLNERQEPLETVVCWTIELIPVGTDPIERLGWAAGRVLPRSAGRTEIQNRVQLWQVPLSAIGGPMTRMLGLGRLEAERMPLGVNSSIHLDERSQLSRFESSVTIGDGPVWCTITGVNSDGQLDVSARLGKNIPRSIGSYQLGSESVVNDGNAPRGYMPPLKVGQNWKTQQLSPLKPGGAGDVSSESLEANVMREEDIFWNGHLQKCWLVEFRRDSGAGSKWAETPLRQMWVRLSDGMVLREDIQIVGLKLRFVRQPWKKGNRLADALEKDWSANVSEEMMPRDIHGHTENKPQKPKPN